MTTASSTSDRSRFALAARLTAGLRVAATFDVCPAFSARVRRLAYHPLGVLVLAATASLLCGLFLHPQGFVLCGGILAVVALGLLWPWLSLHGLSGTVAFDRKRASEGEPVEVRLTLHNRLPWAAWGLAVRDGFGADSATVAAIASAPRGRTILCRWAFQPLCRGIYPATVPKLMTGFPFGLWENRRPLNIDEPLVVWPRTFPVGPIPPVRGDRQVEGNVSRSKVGSNGDVLGVRPYRRGDSPRRIHWGQSARHDRLIVCELQANSRPVIQIVLDADPSVHVGTGPDSSRESAIRVAASLAQGWLEEGAQVGLAWGGQDVPPASGQAQLHKLMDALAGLPDTCETPLTEVLACPRCRGFRDGLQVIVTTDRAHAHQGCGACAAEDQRWVVLKAEAFGESATNAAHRPGPPAWLFLESAASIPSRLLGGWREARHGS